jgi:hypothetical protein
VWLAAVVWLPPALARELVSVDRLLEGYLRFENHFVYLHQLLFSPWGHGISVPGYQEDGMSFALGWPHLALLAVALGLRFLPAGRERDSLLPVGSGFLSVDLEKDGPERDRSFPAGSGFLGLAILACVLLLLPAASVVWERLPLLQYVQFPWRLLAPASFCLSLLVAQWVGWGLGRLLEKPLWTATVGAILILPGVGHFAPAEYFVVDPAHWTPQQIAERRLAVTTLREYEPRGLTVDWTQPEPHFVSTGSATVSQYRQAASRVGFRAEVGSAARIVLKKAFFPGWRALADGHPAALERTPEGWIALELPAGDHRVELVYRGSPIRRRGKWLSLASLAMLAVVGLVGRFRRPRLAVP